MDDNNFFNFEYNKEKVINLLNSWQIKNEKFLLKWYLWAIKDEGWETKWTFRNFYTYTIKDNILQDTFLWVKEVIKRINEWNLFTDIEYFEEAYWETHWEKIYKDIWYCLPKINIDWCWLSFYKNIWKFEWIYNILKKYVEIDEKLKWWENSKYIKQFLEDR